MQRKNNNTRKFRVILTRLKQFAYFCCAAAGLYSLIMGVSFWIEKSDIFCITQVEVNGARILSGDDIKSLIPFEPNQKIFDIDLESFKKKIEENSYIQHVSIGRKFPGIIKIDIQERIPIAMIMLDKVYFIDAGGYLLPRLPGKKNITDCPIITGISVKEPKPGTKIIDRRMNTVLAFIELMTLTFPELQDNISEIVHNKDGSIALILSDNGVRVDFGQNDHRFKLVKLDYFLRYFDEQKHNNKLHSINLIYQDQIVIKELN